MGLFHRLVRGAALVSLALPIAAGAADSPLALTPASNWVVDYADDSCALRRAFGEADRQVVLELRQFSPNSSFQIRVASDTIATRVAPPRVRFEPDDKWFEPPSALFVDDGAKRGILYTDSFLPNSEASSLEPGEEWTEEERQAREASITALSVRDSFASDLLLMTGSMRAPMAAMRACLDELLTHWGLDPEVQRTLSRKAVPANLRRWTARLRNSYPRDMVRAKRNGAINIRLIVGPDGNPVSCSAQLDISDPSFERTACELSLGFVRFEPALDANGMPITSYYTTPIFYLFGP